MNKEIILKKLKELKAVYKKEGINIVGVFGSVTKDTFTVNSDIDIAYSLQKDLFFSKYQGFASVSKISDTKDELSKVLKYKVDLISIENSNQKLVDTMKSELIYI